MINMLLYLMKRQPGTAAPGQAAEICGPKEPLIPGVLRRKPHRPFGEFCIVEHMEKDIYGILFIYIYIHVYIIIIMMIIIIIAIIITIIFMIITIIITIIFMIIGEIYIYIWKMNRCAAKPIIYMGTC